MALNANAFSLMTWPWDLARANIAVAETWMAVPAVVGARLPLIREAVAYPFAANHGELNRMVTEKLDAFGLSQRSLANATGKLKAVGEANARDLGRWAGGTPLWPADWMRIAERNLDLFATLTSLPVRAISPIHRTATANTRRLRS